MTPTKTGRNAALSARRAAGATKADLAREFSISVARVDQLLARAATPAKTGPVRPVTDGERDYPSAAAAARAHGTTRQRAWDRAHFGVRGWKFLGPAAATSAPALASLALLTLVPVPVAAQDGPPPPAAAPPRPCGRLAVLAATLAGRYGEAPVERGLAEGGSLLVVFASADGDTWTAAQVSPSGVACVIATGRGWQGGGKVPARDGTPS